MIDAYLRTFIVAPLFYLGALFPLNAFALSDNQLTELLDWLGARVDTEQIEQLATNASTQLVADNLVSESAAQKFLSVVTNKLSGDAFNREMQQTVTKSVDARVLQNAYDSLNSPLPARARNFDIVMEMTGAMQKFESWRESSPTEDEQRASAVSRLNAANRQAVYAAILQSSLDTALRSYQPSLELSPTLMMAQLQQRKAVLAELHHQLNSYCYRFMRVDEVERLADVMEDDSIQAVIDVIHAQADDFLRKGLSDGS